VMADFASFRKVSDPVHRQAYAAASWAAG
jgi:hypothetical protein